MGKNRVSWPFLAQKLEDPKGSLSTKLAFAEMKPAVNWLLVLISQRLYLNFPSHFSQIKILKLWQCVLTFFFGLKSLCEINVFVQQKVYPKPLSAPAPSRASKSHLLAWRLGQTGTTQRSRGSSTDMVCNPFSLYEKLNMFRRTLTLK